MVVGVCGVGIRGEEYEKERREREGGRMGQ